MANNGFNRGLRRTKNKFVDFLANKGKQNLIVIAALVVLVAIFAILNPNFINKNNIVSMAQSLAPYAMLALGVTFVIATGGIDYGDKRSSASQNFGGGGGTGLSITPIAFLIVGRDADVNIFHIENATGEMDRVISLIERSPEIIEKIKQALS